MIDSHDILQYLDSISGEKKLYPEDPHLRNRVETLEKLFDEKLGVAIRTWSYYYAIQKPLAIAIAWGINAPLIEKIKTAIALPKIPQLLQQFYNVTPETKDAALKKIREVFALVSQEINSGQQYLVGDCLSAADITFAALASPILRPQNHPVYSSQLSKMSPERVSVIEELRSTPAGKLATNLYEQHRL
ncbi:glutathione S-transferase family protein [Waterburya agarophytonicola K14]|uniref:Glutathione S-transferase family protein n=1 Tax=Waterburya agarophytonicola KI4 TaxID=2874699 RepID=A0A964FJ93_9CYAN|nr:glutathione binding-like protein [Waterburya agarophytonicola]MCC0178979.1 glutathione S-transferase family protein [Waterburya agarophytonicola KI4]